MSQGDSGTIENWFEKHVAKVYVKLGRLPVSVSFFPQGKVHLCTCISSNLIDFMKALGSWRSCKDWQQLSRDLVVTTCDVSFANGLQTSSTWRICWEFPANWGNNQLSGAIPSSLGDLAFGEWERLKSSTVSTCRMYRMVAFNRTMISQCPWLILDLGTWASWSDTW